MIAIGAIIFDIWLVNSLVGLSPGVLGDRGNFGDAFGASTSLFSGMAFAGVVCAILLQRAEIGIAKDELERTKRILESQSFSVELQNEQAKKQMFENTYFQLLRLFTELTSSMDIVGQTTVRGKDVFSSSERSLKQRYDLLSNGGSQVNLENAFGYVCGKRQSDLRHYFRTLYTILEFVHGSETPDKKFYTNIVRAQLSNSELHLLLHNGAYVFGVERLKPLLEDYEFFDNLPAGQMYLESVLKEYDRKAFGGNRQLLELAGAAV